jgi:hypothetical protein
MYRCLFVASIDNANALTLASIIDSGYMPTAECEDDFDSLPFEDLGDEPAAVDHAHGELRFLIKGFIGLFVFLDTLYQIGECRVF